VLQKNLLLKELFVIIKLVTKWQKAYYCGFHDSD
jgi:hypothetical protein